MPPIIASVTAAAAGALILVSMTPEIAANWRDPRRALGQSPWRSGLQAAGNLIWVMHGIATYNVSLSLVASLGTLLAAILLTQAWRARRRVRQSRGITRTR